MKKKRICSMMIAWGEIVTILGILMLTGWMIRGYIHPESGAERETETDLSLETDSSPVSERRDAEEAGTADSVIRVKLLTDGFEAEYHDRIEVISDCAYSVTWQNGEEKHLMLKPEEPFCIAAADLNTGDILKIKTGEDSVLRLNSLNRADGNPEYAGILYVYHDPKGLILVNEILLETYLCSVVSSEMPSYYPLEAQKAQAVCARTYAWKHMNQNTENGQRSIADLDDSVMYQVYNNYRSTEPSREAVRATKGQILKVDEPLYYSTSCLSENRDDLQEEEAFREFLEKQPEATEEYGSAWLRWEVILHLPGDIRILERSGNGQVQKMLIADEEGERVIEGEYQIRCELSPKNSELILMDGSCVAGMELLPSAFFYVKEAKAGMVTLCGGGYGHGIGMSQCGAAQMAEEGQEYQEILYYYYGEEAEGL